MNEDAYDRKFNFEEYMEWEETREERNELVNGRVVNVTGCTGKHNLINIALCLSIYRQLRGSKYDTFMISMKLLIRKGVNPTVRYPNVMVCCPPYIDESVADSAALIAEVVSPETEYVDRVEKLVDYQSIMKEGTYLLACEERCQVTAFQFKEGLAKITTYKSGDTIEIEDLRLSIPVDEIYEDVDEDGID